MTFASCPIRIAVAGKSLRRQGQFLSIYLGFSVA
jgi:hypothetical protein